MLYFHYFFFSHQTTPISQLVEFTPFQKSETCVVLFPARKLYHHRLIEPSMDPINKPPFVQKPLKGHQYLTHRRIDKSLELLARRPERQDILQPMDLNPLHRGGRLKNSHLSLGPATVDLSLIHI